MGGGGGQMLQKGHVWCMNNVLSVLNACIHVLKHSWALPFLQHGKY